MTNIEFARLYKQMAMNAVKGTSVLPETLLTQAILESGSGTSDGAKKYGNFFGIKADPSWTGKKVLMDTVEYKNGKKVHTKSYFRVYDNPEDSFKDYVKFLQENPRYKTALTKTNYKDQLSGIAKAGYATDPKYTKKTLEISNYVNQGLNNGKPVVTSKKQIYPPPVNQNPPVANNNLNPVLNYDPNTLQIDSEPVVTNTQLSPIQPFQNQINYNEGLPGLVNNIASFPRIPQSNKQSFFDRLFGDGNVQQRNPFVQYPNIDTPSIQQQPLVQPSFNEPILPEPILPSQELTQEISPVEQPISNEPVIPQPTNLQVSKDAIPSNMMRAPGYEDSEGLVSDFLNGKTSKPFISPLNPNYKAPQSNFNLFSNVPTQQSIPAVTTPVISGTPSNMMRVPDEESINYSVPLNEVDPNTGVNPYKMQWLTDPVRNQMTELKDITLPEPTAETKPEVNHYKPYDINPFTTGLNLFNVGLNTIGGLHNMHRLRGQENLNSFVTQQPEAIYPNKRMLYGDKAMFAEYGGQYNYGGMYPEGGSVYNPDAIVGELVEYKKGGIYIKPENKGKFTAWAKSHGMSVQEAASHVMANKEKYSSTIVKRANFAKNASKFKHEDGGQYSYGGHYIPQDVNYIGGTFVPNPIDLQEFAEGGWIKKAVNPKHKGYCTPMTKSTCTPKRKALAKTFKKHHGFHEEGGEYELTQEEIDNLKSQGYDLELL